MNMHSRPHVSHRETQEGSRRRPAKSGLWKLLAAAALILLGLAVVVELFEDTESAFNAPDPAQQTQDE
ncbi:hypothetical protein [Xaviernesmea oryzae]|uniref:Uncharacterized protein n=1 Tax=Xaviernesmea oryzae TaxID=464029 RepID=A0A1X7D4Y5_9HYPH|nr:hypothetical protein [Xaviernesmea oryzae]SMF08931.1 hypothetical protein SAMN02982989_5037 [Xaviernesmea oryzae]